MEGCFMFQLGEGVCFSDGAASFLSGGGTPWAGQRFCWGFFEFFPHAPPLPNMKNPNKGAQNWYPDAENSLYQPPPCFLAQDFVYSIESLGEIILQIRIFELGFILSHSIG